MVETDASDGVLGGILLQLQPSGEWHPVAYYSKTMILAEINYPIHDKEMLAIIRVLEAWRPELEGSTTCIQLEAWRPELEGSTTRIRIVSDHKALEYFMTTKSLSGRQARWAETLSRFNFMLTYKPGSQNWADLLTCRDQEMDSQMAIKISTRMQTLLQPENLDLETRKWTANCTSADLETLRQKATDRESSWTVRNGLLLFDNRLVVPEDNELKDKAKPYGLSKNVTTGHTSVRMSNGLSVTAKPADARMLLGTFVSEFWKEFNRILGTKIKLSTAAHPQTDGQTENMNQWIDQRLCPYVNYYQDN
ncbi:hypothetical protein V502_00565, partial [Pseudogymnoascus sp. VKM F-4520 (FW-2644)]